MEKKQVHIVIQEQEFLVQKEEKRKKTARVWIVSIAAIIMLYIFSFMQDLLCFGVGVGVLALVLWNVIGAGAGNKNDFFMQLLYDLQHDIARNSKIRYRLDQTSYSDASKKTWEGRSMHGNYKYKSTDHWLSFDFICTDNTKIKIDCTTKYKVRKGSVLKEKYFLSIVFSPNTDFYALDPHETLMFLKEMVEMRVHNDFDEPIQSWVYPRPGDKGMQYRVKVVQQDEPYTVEQLVGLLRPMFGYFAQNKRKVG